MSDRTDIHTAWPGDIVERAARVRLLALDVDGVLTDGRLLLGDDGVERKAFHVRDGHGLKMLRQCGIEVAVISARASKLVGARMLELGVEHVYLGETEKLTALDTLLNRLALTYADTAYVGDDLLDLPLIARVGLGVAVADAHPVVRRHAHWCTVQPGGNGAVREVCDLVLDAQGQLERLVRGYLLPDPGGLADPGGPGPGSSR